MKHVGTRYVLTILKNLHSIQGKKISRGNWNPFFRLCLTIILVLFHICPSSSRALNVLNSAKDLVQSLDEADNAQKKAKSAIEQANDDIASARADLEEV